MDNEDLVTVLISTPDEAERGILADAIGAAGLKPAFAQEAERLDAAGWAEALDATLRAESADFLLVDAGQWLEIRDLLPLPPRSYLVIILLSPEKEGSAANLLESGAFDYLLREGELWAERVGGYFRALSALKRRFLGAFSSLERRYENLVHSLPDIVYELDDEGRFTFINNSVRLLGYDPADLVGRHFSVLLNEEDAAVVDRSTVLELFKGARTGPALSPKLFNERRAIDRRTENLEVRLRRKSGTRAGSDDMIATVISYGEVTAAGEYEPEGEIPSFVGSVGVIRDITLRRKSEEMLRELYQAVDQFNAGVLVADRNFRVEYVNPTFFRISALAPQDVLGSELFSFFDIDARQAEEFRSLVLGGFDVRDEVRLKPRLGSAERRSAEAGSPGAESAAGGSWTAIHASPVRSPAGSVTHAILICEDIGRRKAMEELVDMAREEAERANKAKSDFLASMSHELKSPVASVLAAARLIEMGSPEPERRASAIIASAQGLLGILGDILDFVRFETGAGTVRKYAFPLASFVARACESARAAAEAKGLEFILAPVPDETILSDPDRLERALAALVDNAVTFTEKGFVRVDAAVERRPGNVPYLLVTVADSGEGIPAEDQGRIFSPFVQLASPYTKRGGAGIGLSLARNIVRALGGEIRLHSEVAKGSAFTILLPVGEPAPAPSAVPGPNRVYRLLVVDDNEVNLEYMAAILANAGHRTDTASSGAEALRLLEERPPDCAILDIQMPGMSGIELGRKIRSYSGNRYDPDLPLIALTAFDPEEVARSGVDFDAVFAKPVDVPKLLERMDEAVDLRERLDSESYRSIWSGRGAELGQAISAADADVPRLLEDVDAATRSGRVESVRAVARELDSIFSHLALERAGASLRRLVLALEDEDQAVARSRAVRLAAAWARLRGGSAAAEGSA
ncbi:MAG TPA: ATP-binding protein [Rectinemataceae bacterium]|nr:ATP-binding protein [Rectinemataceae bacterium]